ncbi:hypothetical protein E4U28_000088 [Claviceps purpurea]|nr:hypothetical protein E4U28_000088 [Claviceps purpurea]
MFSLLDVQINGPVAPNELRIHIFPSAGIREVDSAGFYVRGIRRLQSVDGPLLQLAARCIESGLTNAILAQR